MSEQFSQSLVNKKTKTKCYIKASSKERQENIPISDDFQELL